MVYERGLILQITLLPAELRAKGARFESKGRHLVSALRNDLVEMELLHTF